jgi:hypothetical protein
MYSKRSKELAKRKIPTGELAKRFGVLATSINHSVCKRGHWQGLKPCKTPNGRNFWDDVYPEDVAV